MILSQNGSILKQKKEFLNYNVLNLLRSYGFVRL
jgi:hypothetical protein